MSGKKVIGLALGLFSCALFVGGATYADNGHAEGGVSRCYGPNAKLRKPFSYNPASSTLVKGTVESVDSVTYPNGQIIHVKVKTPEGIMMVMLGPASYYNSSNIALQPGDKVEITGSSVFVNGEEVIIASQVRKNGKVLELRDSHGNPFWKNNR